LYQFESCGNMQERLLLGSEQSPRLQAQYRPKPLSPGKNRVPHGAMNGSRVVIFRGKHAIESAIDEGTLGLKDCDERGRISGGRYVRYCSFVAGHDLFDRRSLDSAAAASFQRSALGSRRCAVLT